MIKNVQLKVIQVEQNGKHKHCRVIRPTICCVSKYSTFR